MTPDMRMTTVGAGFARKRGCNGRFAAKAAPTTTITPRSLSALDADDQTS